VGHRLNLAGEGLAIVPGHPRAGLTVRSFGARQSGDFAVRAINRTKKGRTGDEVAEPFL
jgi:hypothetical protein